MSFQSTSLRQAKNVAIPDHVPVGAVIGKGGSYCKAMRENHGVRYSVDGTDRKVTLIGPGTGVKSAEEELTDLFASFAINKQEENRVFEVVAPNGPTRWWSFQQDMETSSDEQVQEYPYRLKQSGRAIETSNENTISWIKEFREDDMANVMDYLLEKPSKSPLKIKIAFGKLCFKLSSIDCKSSTIAWSELQKLRNFEEFMTRWSNYCSRSSPSITALMDDLESWMEKGVEPRKTLSVHVAGCKGGSYGLKYHLVDRQWELHSAYTRRYVRGTYDVILDNDTSFRVRAVSHEVATKSASADIQHHLDISTPNGGDFLRTKVELSRNAPAGMQIKSFEAKSKVHVDANGLRFSIFYLDKHQDEFRLECRLATVEKEKMSTKDNEAQVLLMKVLEVLA
ncbi:KH domain [Phytophthora infestans]|uniref:KH domain n=1 Tax=Phytophthora infestans TaxID=4787 RepID=A0A833T4H5_PHYIN|nr:KH domain [Phytophthora infestans]KAF4137964.1 KH domain [Phytophthora infestans]